MTLVARHSRPKELKGVSIDEIAKRYVAQFGERNVASSGIQAASPTPISFPQGPLR